MRNNFIIRLFLQSAGTLLVGTALAKFISALGTAGILKLSDPVLGMPFRLLFCIVGVLEMTVAGYCFLDHDLKFRTMLVAWLGTAFGVYRVALAWVGAQKHCPCLGNLTDAIHISPHVADDITKCLLAYLLIGSYAALFWLWWQRKSASASSPA